MIEKSPDVSRIVDRLIDLGFVRRRRQRTDRRVVITTITKKGTDLLETMDKPVLEEISAVFSHMEEGDMRSLVSLLEKARDSLYKALRS
jgi:DNA-binding MarR family transcriptional regulator